MWRPNWLRRSSSKVGTPTLRLHNAASIGASALATATFTALSMPEMPEHGESLPSSSMRHSSAVVDDDDNERDPHIPGSIPPWVHISSSEDDTLIPPPVRPNTRHYKPPPSHYKPGRKWDHIRSAEPPLMSAPIADHQTRWAPFMQSGPHPPIHGQGARLMSPEWMEDNVPITVRGWEEEDEALADKQEELKGFWLLSAAKRDRTVRLFWVSPFSAQFFSGQAIFLHAWFVCIAATMAASWRPCCMPDLPMNAAMLACNDRVEVEPLAVKSDKPTSAPFFHRISRFSSPGRAPD
jgi:hypothetical protein